MSVPPRINSQREERRQAVLYAAQVKTQLQGMRDTEGNVFTDADSLIAELVRKLSLITTLAQWDIRLTEEVLDIRMHGRTLFTIARARMMLTALLSRYPNPITDVAAWQARNPCPGVRGNADTLRAQCLRAYQGLVARGLNPPSGVVIRDDYKHDDHEHHDRDLGEDQDAVEAEIIRG